jgi:hypothetical protein
MLEPQPQPMLVPMQAFMDPKQLQFRLVLGLMLELMLQPGLALMLEPKLELMPQLGLVLVLALMPMLLLGPGLILRFEPELTPIIQLVVPLLEQQLMDQQPEQHQAMASLIVVPEQQLAHLEQQPVITRHHHKAFD